MVSGGIIDGAFNFDGINDRIQLSQLMTSEGKFTFEAWANTASKQGYLVAQRDTLSNGAFIQYYPASNEFQLYSNSVLAKQPGAASQWKHIVGVYDGTQLRLYVDGVSTTPQAASVTWPAVPMMIGDRSISGRQFQGMMDEVRISRIARSDGYIKTSFNNQKNPSAFITVSAEQSKNNMPVVSNVMPADGTLNAQLNPTLSGTITDPDGDSFNYSVELQQEDTWTALAKGSGTGVGTFSVSPTTAIDYETMYAWRIVIFDLHSGTSETFINSFTTLRQSNNLPTMSNPMPADGSIDIPLQPQLSVDVIDADGDNVAWSIQVNSGGWQTAGSGTLAGGVGKISATGMQVTSSQTPYRWRVTLNDGFGTAVQQTFNFTTMYVNPPAQILNEIPANNSQDVPLNPTLQAEILDFENESITWQIDIYNCRHYRLIRL
jgi:hypothetical protein